MNKLFPDCKHKIACAIFSWTLCVNVKMQRAPLDLWTMLGWCRAAEQRKKEGKNTLHRAKSLIINHMMSCKSSEGEVSKLSQLSKYKSMVWPISHPHGAPTEIWTFLHLALFKTHHKSAARQCALTVRAPDCLQNPVDAKRGRRVTTTFQNEAFYEVFTL